jgi:hypothetical protein
VKEANFGIRTLIHLDAEAQLGTYDDEGKIRQRLNLVQRMLSLAFSSSKEGRY